MNYIILLFAILLLLTGLVILIKPMSVFGVMSAHSSSLKLHIFAVVVRLVLGIALLIYAQHSKFPLTLEVIGWLSIAAAIVLAVMGRARFKQLIDWAMTVVPRFGRVSGLLAVLFGGFLGYAVV